MLQGLSHYVSVFSKIYDEAFFGEKKAPSKMFDRVLNTPLRILNEFNLACMTFSCSRYFINLFHATGLFLYLLKTSGNLWFSDVFRGYRKRPMT